jgi:hypothetical protein
MGFFLVAIYELEIYLKSKEVAQYYSMQSNGKGLDRRSLLLRVLLFFSYFFLIKSIMLTNLVYSIQHKNGKNYCSCTVVFLVVEI